MQQLGASLDAVYLKDVFEDDASVHLVMELCAGGPLLERVSLPGGPAHSERYIADILRSVLRFVAQCHAKGIVYRDVKPDNFLFQSASPDSPLKARCARACGRRRPTTTTRAEGSGGRRGSRRGRADAGRVGEKGGRAAACLDAHPHQPPHPRYRPHPTAAVNPPDRPPTSGWPSATSRGSPS